MERPPHCNPCPRLQGDAGPSVTEWRKICDGKGTTATAGESCFGPRLNLARVSDSCWRGGRNAVRPPTCSVPGEVVFHLLFSGAGTVTLDLDLLDLAKSTWSS